MSVDRLIEQDLRRAVEGGEQWRELGTTGEPAFQNGWANKGSGNTPMAFRKTMFGQVELRGMLQNSAGSNATVAFTLPAGYRPKTMRTLVQIGSSLSGGVQVGRAQIETDGDVLMALSSSSGAIGDMSCEGFFTVV